MTNVCKVCRGEVAIGDREGQEFGGHASCIKLRLGKILLKVPTKIRQCVTGPLSGAATMAALKAAATLTGRELLAIAVDQPAEWAAFTGWYEQSIGPLPNLAEFRNYMTLQERQKERGRILAPAQSRTRVAAPHPTPSSSPTG
ncbi:MAG TPA: hypothetical protein VJZ94_00175 [Candidatus Paceibacterota bacterium]|uniref:Uncharacterized protein n=1 Tax=Candidatus Uhrbacteria bacterium RIFCSPLOWO2_01_FULL_47_24 TaxID=1802401 RepID=A0A1F7UR23_9BACT|nr:MAG: hypothetical protein A2753_01855 [Candidatus Uhrbacteria bacterium RIFCSPHIGHO2_01_FULL_47_11]OGL67962.1 MAG: hypothetical protein A3D58_05300 [Candidatus Uhrbacteria bacterium RIFCSPHIGHO2_02_FULL_46_47]OGL76451.1 MAG: hypothetical protein A3F52_02940 [Candidatus Uhrbacteria bacterium RIFCSPHIGHO2_12_FULL_47_11]OGL80148.1 MAG: hypothetical protein A3B21_02105 [Candidatus Uhrbacteria bacterium RIFCSPLOWO2_01_FULL_47_24]OGL84932.1 MAG: hypothetical protein A3J03_04485 [Candidatus Uhrbact